VRKRKFNIIDKKKWKCNLCFTGKAWTIQGVNSKDRQSSTTIMIYFIFLHVAKHYAMLLSISKKMHFVLILFNI